MAVVPYDKELEAMEEEERQLDLEIAKQEKSQQIAEKRRKLQELSSVGSSSTAAVPTVTRTATLTVKTSKYEEHGESRTTEKSAGLTAMLSKDLEVGYKEHKAKAVEIQWKKSDDRVGTLPFSLDQPSGSGAIDPTQAFLSAMGITSEEINRLKKK